MDTNQIEFIAKERHTLFRDRLWNYSLVSLGGHFLTNRSLRVVMMIATIVVSDAALCYRIYVSSRISRSLSITG